MRKGEELGLQKGRIEGEATVLRRQLALKFGSLDEVVDARISRASAEQILAWAERVLTAETLDGVFGDLVERNASELVIGKLAEVVE